MRVVVSCNRIKNKLKPKTMLVIYFNKEKKWKQIVRPSKKFDGSYLQLVQHITKSNDDVKKYHSYEIL